MRPLPHTGSRSANGFSATASWADFSRQTSISERDSREVMSMSRDFVRSALLRAAVPRNNLGIIVGERENFVGGGQFMPVILPPVTGVDVGIHAVEKRVTHLNHVGLLKMNVDVRIRMRGSKVLEREGFAIGLQLVTVGKVCCGKASAGEGSKCKSCNAPVWSSITKIGRSCGSDIALLVFSWARTVAPSA